MPKGNYQMIIMASDISTQQRKIIMWNKTKENEYIWSHPYRKNIQLLFHTNKFLSHTKKISILHKRKYLLIQTKLPSHTNKISLSHKQNFPLTQTKFLLSLCYFDSMKEETETPPLTTTNNNEQQQQGLQQGVTGGGGGWQVARLRGCIYGDKQASPYTSTNQHDQWNQSPLSSPMHYTHSANTWPSHSTLMTTFPYTHSAPLLGNHQYHRGTLALTNVALHKIFPQSFKVINPRSFLLTFLF